jgi:hypothetical protein
MILRPVVAVSSSAAGDTLLGDADHREEPFEA